MCSVTNYKPELHIATEDIVCYKKVTLVKRSYLFRLLKKYIIYSSVKNFHYELDELYKSELNSFSRHFDGLYYSNRGFYSYKDKHSDCNVKCIIPKGSKYYLTQENTFYCCYQYVYISDQIKIVEILK